MQLQINDIVEQYRIIKKIAQGGMGAVYLAEDQKLKRQVILKFLETGKTISHQIQQQFLNEARAIAGLKHPNIVTVHEISEFQGNPFIAMEYLEGNTLDELIKQKGCFDQEEGKLIFEQVCDAVAAIHDQGLIHGDLKPSNIIIDQDNKIKIIDFGLVTGQDHQIESAFVSSGTTTFMAPELHSGNAPTQLSDIFSLGIIYYQLLSGHLPFSGDYEASIKYAIMHEDPIPLNSYITNIDFDTKSLIDKLLEKDPQKRYQSVSSILHDLRGTDNVTVPKQSSLVVWKVLGAVLLLLLILIGSIYYISKDVMIETEEGKVYLAVLPFEDYGEPVDTSFADLISYALNANLTDVKDLKVIYHPSVIIYKNSDKEISEIGNELGVRYLLTGSVHWDDSKTKDVRIFTVLVDSKDDSHLWSDHFDGKTADLFQLQTDISNKVIKELKIVLSDEENKALTHIPTQNNEALDLYIRGNEYFNRSWEKSDIAIAMKLYHKSIELDSNFAEPYAMLARGYASMYWEYYDRSDSIKNNARRYMEKSLSLRPDLSIGYQAEGYYYYHCERTYDKALESFNKGLLIENDNPEILNGIAAIQRRDNKFGQALESFKGAFRLDPLSHLKAFDIALTFGMLRQYDSSRFYTDKALTLAPDYALGHIYQTWLPIIEDGDIEEAKEILKNGLEITDLTSSKYYWWLQRILEKDSPPVMKQMTPGTDSISYYLYLGQWHRLHGNNQKEKEYASIALRLLLDKLENIPASPRYTSSLGLAYAMLRDKENAIEYGMKPLKSGKESFDTPFYILNVAEILIIFEEYDTAVMYLNELVKMPGFFSMSYFLADPLFNPLHDNEKFKELLTQF